MKISFKNPIFTRKENAITLVSIILLINFSLRIFILNKTELFRFGDYSAYLGGVENLTKGESLYLLNGNFLFAISYLGYYAEKVFESLEFFFVFNCIIATLTSFLLYYLVVKVTGSTFAGIITIIIHTFYTEFMVFSSVFYTPVLMIFLLSLFLLFVYLYLDSATRMKRYLYLGLSTFVFLLTFFFKPELKYLPCFLLLTGLFFMKRNRPFFKKMLLLSFLLFAFSFLLQHSNLITHPKGNVISNSFVFFGHTDYGGDGGEGSFVYPANKARYDAALAEYFKVNNITSPTLSDYNSFQNNEIKNFIIHHPLNWINLQFTKFFRTFGVVPESTSFKILYTGLFKGNLWFTSIIVVAPVALIILLFIALFSSSSIKQLFNFSTFQPLNSVLHPRSNNQHLEVQQKSLEQIDLGSCRAPRTPNPAPHTNNKKHFLYIYCLLFFYYLIATIFYGQYQERYRLPLMVVFIIPALGYFIANFDRDKLLNRISLVVKGTIIILFLAVWTSQARKAISNKERLNNAIEKIGGRLE